MSLLAFTPSAEAVVIRRIQAVQAGIAAAVVLGFEIGAGCLGHGLGLGHHERRHLVPGSKTRLAEGMVLAFEPAIFRPEYGVTQSDVVVIGAGSMETVTDWTSFLA